MLRCHHFQSFNSNFPKAAPTKLLMLLSNCLELRILSSDRSYIKFFVKVASIGRGLIDFWMPHLCLLPRVMEIISSCTLSCSCEKVVTSFFSVPFWVLQELGNKCFSLAVGIYVLVPAVTSLKVYAAWCCINFKINCLPFKKTRV